MSIARLEDEIIKSEKRLKREVVHGSGIAKIKDDLIWLKETSYSHTGDSFDSARQTLVEGWTSYIAKVINACDKHSQLEVLFTQKALIQECKDILVEVPSFNPSSTKKCNLKNLTYSYEYGNSDIDLGSLEAAHLVVKSNDLGVYGNVVCRIPFSVLTLDILDNYFDSPSTKESILAHARFVREYSVGVNQTNDIDQIDAAISQYIPIESTGKMYSARRLFFTNIKDIPIKKLCRPGEKSKGYVYLLIDGVAYNPDDVIQTGECISIIKYFKAGRNANPLPESGCIKYGTKNNIAVDSNMVASDIPGYFKFEFTPSNVNADLNWLLDLSFKIQVP